MLHSFSHWSGCLLLALLFVQPAQAQQASEKAQNAAYVEIGGTGFVYSLNYERRIPSPFGGIHARVGFMYLPPGIDPLFEQIIPLSASFLIPITAPSGSAGALEVGVHKAVVLIDHYDSGRGFGQPPLTVMAGYRQVWNNGVMLRLVFTPLWVPPTLEGETDRDFAPWAGFGVGYTF